MKTVCFTLDDTIRFFEELTKNRYATLAEAPFLGLLYRLHQRFGAKFQLNVFYSYAPGGFSLADVPSLYRAQFSHWASWLKFSFHSAYNAPPFPYAKAGPAALLKEYDAVQKELLRIVGPNALARTTTLHYAAARRAAMEALAGRGIQGFVAMAYHLPGDAALQYHLTAEQGARLRKQDVLWDEATGLGFLRNHLILNKTRLQDLPGQLAALCEKPLLQLMTHEQYFYKEYENYQPDYAAKMELCWKILHTHGYRAAFVEDALSLFICCKT